jgi:hypothetical protein
MKNILIIAYYFPPSGGPGVQRVLKYVQYLREFNYNPIVLTVENGDFPARDESLLEKIPKDIKVYRTRIYEPYDLYRFLTGKSKNTPVDVNVIKKENQKIKLSEKFAEIIRSTFFIPDARIGWILTAYKKVLKIINDEKIDGIYTSSPPYTTSLIGRYAKRKTGLAWIAGFRDPWTGFISAPKRWFLPKKIDQQLEKTVFEEADLIEVAWIGIKKDALNKYPDLDENKFIHIPNGFDSNDFEYINTPENKKFTITYTGSMYGRRNPYSLFKTIEMLVEENLISKNDFKIRLIGRFGNEIFEMINNASFKENIEIINYLPHKQSIIELQRSDVLLLIVDESKESEEIVPGKVYEYLGVKKPILAIGPEKGAIADLLSETNAGLIAHQSNIEKIKENLLNFYYKWKNKEILYNPNLNEINKYERKNAAKKLAELFNEIIK